MKKLLVLSFAFFLVLSANADNNTSSLNKGIKPDMCCATVTASGTASGPDCNGNMVTITAYSTQTRCLENDCLGAYAAANRAARTSATVQATVAVTVIGSDCPPPPQP